MGRDTDPVLVLEALCRTEHTRLPVGRLVTVKSENWTFTCFTRWVPLAMVVVMFVW